MKAPAEGNAEKDAAINLMDDYELNHTHDIKPQHAGTCSKSLCTQDLLLLTDFVPFCELI